MSSILTWSTYVIVFGTLGVLAFYTIALPRALAESSGMTQVGVVLDEAIKLAANVSLAWDAERTNPGRHLSQLSETQPRQPRKGDIACSWGARAFPNKITSSRTACQGEAESAHINLKEIS